MRQLLTECGALPWPRLSRFVDAAARGRARAASPQGLLCGLSPDIMRVAIEDDWERLMISSAGIWDAQDLLGTLQEQTLRGMALADSELRYVAPELFTGRTADVRSDVFTLGVLIYEMATGRSAIRRCHAAGAARQDAHGTPAIRWSCSRRCRPAAAAIHDRAEHGARSAVRGRGSSRRSS